MTTLKDVETLLLVAAPWPAEVPELLESELSEGEDHVVPDLPISIYGGG